MSMRSRNQLAKIVEFDLNSNLICFSIPTGSKISQRLVFTLTFAVEINTA